MQRTTELGTGQPPIAPAPTTPWNPSRLLLPLAALLLTLFMLVVGFFFLRDSHAPQIITALVAVIWGVGGVAALFAVANVLVEALPGTWGARIQPYIFVGPAIAILTWYLFLPAVRTFIQSLYEGTGGKFVGLNNYIQAFTSSDMLLAFRNNLIWLIFGTAACVILGLLVAVLADRSRFESVAKALIFMPMAISFVGAGVIWRFIYAYAPVDAPQIGLLNAIGVGMGGQPQSWLTQQPWNNLFLILVLVWMQTGFAMVIFSAALKGVPADVLEAARVDGAGEFQTFFRIIIPQIQGTILTVTTTLAIFTLKIFDVVIVMTGGNYGTGVVATQFYQQFFNNRGYGSAIAIVLFIAVLPVMYYNLRQLRSQEGF